ncbi:tctex1 domain-containing protein 2-like [Stegodyphus dumicola]|uniref:tctex1 domain-containing protein 2-like n=1 Tax=Stegodyphus dumicola TaxID=202533 RepID=UPI0015ADAA7A|nr:tctex1 domain-containing protein 2-like [Stegodyphus dumicola]
MQAHMDKKKKILNIRPSIEQKFHPSAVEDIIRGIITAELSDKQYDHMYVPEWTKTLSRKIHDRMLEMPYERFKFIVQVVIGENCGQGMVSLCGCLWDEDTDGRATVIFKRNNLYCVATVFAIYCYCYE